MLFLIALKLLTTYCRSSYWQLAIARPKLLLEVVEARILFHKARLAGICQSADPRSPVFCVVLHALKEIEDVRICDSLNAIVEPHHHRKEQVELTLSVATTAHRNIVCRKGVCK